MVTLLGLFLLVVLTVPLWGPLVVVHEVWHWAARKREKGRLETLAPLDTQIAMQNYREKLKSPW